MIKLFDILKEEKKNEREVGKRKNEKKKVEKNDEIEYPPKGPFALIDRDLTHG